MFEKLDHETLTEPLVGEGFRHACAADARACGPHGIMLPLASARMSSKEFNVSATIARKAPFDRNVETIGFSKVSASAREQNF